MDSEQFHAEATRYIRRAVAKSLSGNSDGLTWELIGEPLLRLFQRAVNDAMKENPFAYYVSPSIGEHDEANVGIEFSLLSDCDWIDSISIGGAKNLSNVLIDQLPLYEDEGVLETIAAIERSCQIARAKLSGASEA